jgi:glucose-1-phosphate adenylyltransferase
VLPPQYIADDSVIERCIIGEGSEIYGQVYNSVIGCGVTIGEGTVVRDSIIMNQAQIGDRCVIEKAIIDEYSQIGNDTQIGTLPEKDNDTRPDIYNSGLVTIGEKTIIPSNVRIGKNAVIAGDTVPEDYPDGVLDSGRTLIKAGE